MLGTMTIIFAPSNQIEELRPYVDKVLEVLGHPNAWVSDMSYITDFDETETAKEKKKWLKDISSKLGLDVNKIRSIVEIAKHLKERENTNE